MEDCKQCKSPFEVTEQDKDFYAKVSPVIAGKKYLIPEPTLCPDCRQRRRYSFRNERVFYHRKCDLTGKQIISIYDPKSSFKVYDQEAWWSDKWAPLDFGKEFDFSRPFFDQFQELMEVVPRQALFGKNNENSLYNNHTENNKNCYLCVDTANGENIYYSKYIIKAKDCVDCYMTSNSELCYETQYTEGYNCAFTMIAENCRDSYFLYNCIGCKDCLMCWNLRNKQYCIENKQYSKEEYFRILKSFDLGSLKNLKEYQRRYQELLEKAIRRNSTLINCEDCSGDYLHNCKNVTESYDVGSSRDCKYCYDCDSMTDCYDTYESAFDCVFQYEGYACNRGKNLISCSVSYDVNEVYYCDTCHNSSNLFGCVGLRHKKYCILNKQYAKEEYEELVPKIIEHMRKYEELGEFFPVQLSPFAYNETVAQEYFPLTQDEIEAHGWRWKEEDETSGYQGSIYDVPDDINDIPDDITEKILFCSITGKPYKIIKQELEFYRRMNLPIPKKCPDQRHKERLALRNPRRLWQRKCDKCGKGIETSYSPERPEKVYCEQCYLDTVY